MPYKEGLMDFPAHSRTGGECLPTQLVDRGIGQGNYIPVMANWPERQTLRKSEKAWKIIFYILRVLVLKTAS
jgi:hypothetical protein